MMVCPITTEACVLTAEDRELVNRFADFLSSVYMECKMDGALENAVNNMRDNLDVLRSFFVTEEAFKSM